MLDIIKKQIAYNRSARSKKVAYIVVHDTGNPGKGANAQSHFNYFNGGDRQSSADFFVDDSTIMQVNDYTIYYTWHCGDKLPNPGPLYGIAGNSNSLGIEMCINSDGDYSKMLKNTIDLVQYLMKTLGIGIDNVIRHNDVSGKTCPNTMSANNWAKWKEFKAAVANSGTYSAPSVAPGNAGTGTVTGNTVNFRTGAGTSSSIITTLSLGTVVSVNSVADGWANVTHDGKTGYISTDYLNIVAPPSAPATPPPSPPAPHWGKAFLDKMVNAGFIKSPDQWESFDDCVTRALVLHLLDNVTGGPSTTVPMQGNSHEASFRVNSLRMKGIIGEPEQWTADVLDSPISKALMLALIDKATGGMHPNYVGRTPDHWARNCLDSLCDKGIVSTPEAWVTWDGQVSKAETMAILAKAFVK